MKIWHLIPAAFILVGCASNRSRIRDLDSHVSDLQAQILRIESTTSRSVSVLDEEVEKLREKPSTYCAVLSRGLTNNTDRIKALEAFKVLHDKRWPDLKEAEHLLPPEKRRTRQPK